MRHLLTERIEIDGAAPSAAQLQARMLRGYGHFTALQVRDRRVRGLDLHLDRLAQGNAELFGAGLDRAGVTALIRQALGPDTTDASVRVYLQQPDADEAPSVMVTVRPPAEMPATLSLLPVPYQRSVAHIKHLGDFGQQYYGGLAAAGGYGEALLTGPDGLISEGAITNLGCYDGEAVVWPAAALLRGITMQVLERELIRHGVPVRVAPLRVADLADCRHVFLTNSRGIATASAAGEQVLPADQAFGARLAEIWQDAPWDEL